MSLLRLLGVGGIAAVTLALGFAACSEPEQETDCLPGTELFCRCQGSGDPGTRTCLDDGVTRGECMIAPDTPCGDRVECQEGETVFCVCPDGTAGEKECLRDGTSFGDCLVDGVPCPEETDGPATTSTGPGGGAGQGGSGGGSTGTCAHDECEEGDALDPGCSACASDLCAADPYCCTTEWDVLCIGKTEQYCEGLCGSGPTECAHDPCAEGAALESGCDPCVTSVCAADSVCCDAQGQSGWDQFCVSAAENYSVHPACDGACCAHDPCAEGVALTATCSSCAESVCAGDSFCCGTSWDSMCVTDALQDSNCSCGP
jgi:hypothetical protein